MCAGVFAAMWAKYNQKSNAYNTWIVADGPVDAIWIEVRRHPPHLHTQGEILAPVPSSSSV